MAPRLLPENMPVRRERFCCGVGVLTRVDGDRLTLEGVVLSIDGRERISAQANASADQAEAIGICVAHLLVAQGAERLMGDTMR